MDHYSVTVTGASEYQINGKVVTFSAYNAALVDHNILIKAKNFLVFQGDVEAVASQSPKALTRLIERISGSLELEAEYEKAREEQEKATENATTTFTKRRGMQGEIKQYKEQKSEAERFENLLAERVRFDYFFGLGFCIDEVWDTGRFSASSYIVQTVSHRGEH